MYFFLRGVICVIFLLITLFGINKSKIKNKQRVMRGCLIGFGVLYILLGFLPLESIFFRFDSPTSAYEYRNPDAEAMLVVEGDESAFVIGQRDETELIMMVPKENGKWLVGAGSEFNTVAYRFNGEVTIYIRQCKKTNDYYISVSEVTGKEIHIVDSKNTEFVSLRRETDLFTKYYAFIPDYDENYWITVDGEQIELRKQ